MRYPSVVVIVLRKNECRWEVLFLKKSEKNRWHPGEVCFPGGRIEEDENMNEAVLREFEEEVGVDSSHIEIIASLDPIETVSTPFVIYPLVATTRKNFEPKVDGSEIEEAFWVPLDVIRDYPFDERIYHYKGLDFNTYIIEWDGKIIWGATARILKNFVEKLKELPLDKGTECDNNL
ncbi:MAG: NUDIX hydrolase [Thermosulfidibacteraceae bacterium]|jgi:8-oxo-dGTP pyrophosphatase MutT (NUDIX family)